MNDAVNDGAQVLVMLTSMNAEIRVIINELPVVCAFLEVFPYDINDLPPE